MINFENSLNNKIKRLSNFISEGYETALDIGCGSGADSIALAKSGLKVHAIDQSEGMLKQAKLNDLKHDADISFAHSRLEQLDLENSKYDMIVSLGNTIANINYDDLLILLKFLQDHFNKDGKILLQLINYTKLPQSGSYTLNEYENDKFSLIRKYNIYSSHIDFNSFDKWAGTGYF